ncbi:MAG: class I SAM-dependent methyltransferase, partial [Anaerolineales bacterium]|nr:class I SAM-dependent methyltransferase [Anaerolineales bacterium]
AGSGPIQYPEYLEYSRAYTYRVCADISIQALREARRRIGEHGLFVVADIANLPFRRDAFGGVVSLHTIHHLPQDEHVRAYQELYRVLMPAGSAVVVNGWGYSAFGSRLTQAAKWINRMTAFLRRKLQPQKAGPQKEQALGTPAGKQPETSQQTGTFVRKNDAAWLRSVLGDLMPIQILVWRSVSVHVLRTFIHPWLGGRWILGLLFWVEERWPRWFGENGQYPLVVISKPGETSPGDRE